MEELKKKIEALLFAASKRLTEEEIANILELKIEDVIKNLNLIKQDYYKKDTSLLITNEDNYWKMTLKDDYLSVAEKLMPSTELPSHVIDTLAVIAWKGPILQADLVKWRSPAVYDHIMELEKIKLITKNPKGRSYVLKVTDKFYDYFDIPQEKVNGLFKDYEGIDNVEEETDTEIEEESPEEREKKILEEIKANKIDPDLIIKNDKGFLEDFDKKLREIESASFDAGIDLKNNEDLEQ